MDFGEAIKALKDDRWVRRAGWNGKGMHVYLEEHFAATMPRASVKGKITHSVIGKVLPCLIMFNAQGDRQPGWVASQADMLAEDWEVIPYEEMK